MMLDGTRDYDSIEICILIIKLVFGGIRHDKQWFNWCDKTKCIFLELFSLKTKFLKNTVKLLGEV